MSAWMSKQLWQMTTVLFSNSGKIQMVEQLIFSNPHIGKEESGALKALGLEDYFISKGKEVLEKKYFLKIKHLSKCKLISLFLADVFIFSESEICSITRKLYYMIHMKY